MLFVHVGQTPDYLSAASDSPTGLENMQENRTTGLLCHFNSVRRTEQKAANAQINAN